MQSNLTSKQMFEALKEKERTRENIFSILSRMESEQRSTKDLMEHSDFNFKRAKVALRLGHEKKIISKTELSKFGMFEFPRGIVIQHH